MICSSDEQPSNALFPILVILFGIAIDVMPEQFLKRLGLILVITLPAASLSFSITTFVIVSGLLNGFPELVISP